MEYEKILKKTSDYVKRYEVWMKKEFGEFGFKGLELGEKVLLRKRLMRTMEKVVEDFDIGTDDAIKFWLPNSYWTGFFTLYYNIYTGSGYDIINKTDTLGNKIHDSNYLKKEFIKIRDESKIF